MDNGTPYYRDELCCDTVCALNPSCCSGPWNQACADMALANCTFNSPECGDLVFGLSSSNGLASLELVRGPAVENGGAQIDDFWDGPFIQSVELDNLGGVSHNPLGNLLGVNFGSSASGGSISSFAKCSPKGGGAVIGDTQGLGGNIDQTRLGGLSVSPDNTKIAVVGFDNGLVIVYDYTAGDCSGNGAALSGARQAEEALCTFSTQGTAWKDNNTVLAFSADGRIFEIDANSMDADLITTVDTVTGCGGFTDIEFAPGISDNVYAMYSRFTGGATHNLLFVLDPSDNLALLGTFDYAGSMETSREIAFDVDGNLFVSQFGNFGTPLKIEIIPNGADLGSLANDNSLDWYTSASGSTFNGLDVAQCSIEVPLDIKPGSCPNPMNTHSNGVVPVSVLGTDTFDASEIIISTVQICRADGVGSCVSPNEGPPGPHSVLDDTGTPFEGELCSCHELAGDGLIDLSLKFRTQNMVAAMQLDSEPGGTFIEMVVTGLLLDGTKFNASDCVLIVPPNSGQTSATMQSNVADTFIEVTPLDLTVDSDGFANFSRSYVSGTIVTVTAPTTSQGRRFLRWSVDSVLQPIGVRTMEVTVGENTTLKAYYQRASRLRPHRPSEGSGDME
ncbi:MAG: hypothetical protein IIA33_06880 [Planctomycetes bacterium]|nr:hypothetical protein [Planctomycetota bacterium]